MRFININIYLISRYFACLLLLFIGKTNAQQFNIETFTTKEGLVNDNVRSLAVDSSGFLWAATWDGVSRYDGYSFKSYFHYPNDSLSLPYFSILDLVVDGGNNLWLISDQKNVAIYDRYNDLFKGIRDLHPNMPETCTNISIDESGYLWIINTDSIFRFDFKTRKFGRYGLTDIYGNPMNIGVLPTYSITTYGNLVYLVYDKIYEFEKLSDKNLILRKEYKIESTTPFKTIDFSYVYWYRLYVSESGRKWIYSNAGLFLLDEETGLFREFRGSFPEKKFAGNGFLYWSWYNDGIYIINCKEGEQLHIPHEYCQLVKGVSCQSKDLFWFSNSSMTGASLGFSRVVFTPGYFNNYPLLAGKNDLPTVYAVTKDKFDRIWVGMRGRYPINIISPDKKTTKLEIPEFTDKQNPGAVRSLNVTNEGIWIGFFRELLLFYNFNEKKWSYHKPGSNYFRPIALDKQGKMYLSTDNGRITIYYPDLKKTTAISDNKSEGPLYKIIIGDNGLVWAGSNHSSLIKVDTGLKKSEVYCLSKENYNIEDICIGNDNDLWLALLGGGVCNLKPATGEKRFFTTSNGLSNNITYCLLKDKKGNIWVSTNKGISRINPQTGIIRTFGTAEGLNIVEFNSGASYASDNGEFLMGGMGGLVGFYPDSINIYETETTGQKIIFTEIGASGNRIPFRQSANEPDTIILKKGVNNLRINFSSTDFIHSNKTIYRYALSKINETWVETDSRNRNVSYANLIPGWYSFQLQATDHGGYWSASKELRIRIQPLFYQTLLFRIAVVLALILLFTTAIFFYIRQLKQREAQKQDALRLQSLQGQMNPHFIFNSLNSINYFISKNDPYSANKYIADFSRLIRSILYNFNSDFIRLDKEIDSLQEYLKIEHLRFGDKFDYKVEVDSAIEPGQYMVSPGLVQPFIENSIWHGVRGLEKRKGNVTVRYLTVNGKITCIVEDDGIGRNKAEDAKSALDSKVSKGIYIVTERLKIINKLQKANYKILISDLYPEKQETGTRVVIDIPLKKN
jgi:streptogramin lyase